MSHLSFLCPSPQVPTQNSQEREDTSHAAPPREPSWRISLSDLSWSCYLPLRKWKGGSCPQVKEEGTPASGPPGKDPAWIVLKG